MTPLKWYFRQTLQQVSSSTSNVDVSWPSSTETRGGWYMRVDLHHRLTWHTEHVTDKGSDMSSMSSCSPHPTLSSISLSLCALIKYHQAYNCEDWKGQSKRQPGNKVHALQNSSNLMSSHNHLELKRLAMTSYLWEKLQLYSVYCFIVMFYFGW